MKNNMNIKKLPLLALFACISTTGITYGAADNPVIRQLENNIGRSREKIFYLLEEVTRQDEEIFYLQTGHERPLPKKEYAQAFAYGVFVPLAYSAATIATIKLANPELTAKDCISLSLTYSGLFIPSILSSIYHKYLSLHSSSPYSQERKRFTANAQGSAMTAGLSLIMTAGMLAAPRSDFFEANYKRLFATTAFVNFGYNLVVPVLSAIIKQLRS